MISPPLRRQLMAAKLIASCCAARTLRPAQHDKARSGAPVVSLPPSRWAGSPASLGVWPPFRWAVSSHPMARISTPARVTYSNKAYRSYPVALTLRETFASLFEGPKVQKDAGWHVACGYERFLAPFDVKLSGRTAYL